MGGNPWERATQIKPGQRQESINGEQKRDDRQRDMERGTPIAGPRLSLGPLPSAISLVSWDMAVPSLLLAKQR